jgi:hypothetical protein
MRQLPQGIVSLAAVRRVQVQRNDQLIDPSPSFLENGQVRALLPSLALYLSTQLAS